MRIDHWNHAGELITLETGDVWLETFAKWDAMVPTMTAEAIANAVERELITAFQESGVTQ